MLYGHTQEMCILEGRNYNMLLRFCDDFYRGQICQANIFVLAGTVTDGYIYQLLFSGASGWQHDVWIRCCYVYGCLTMSLVNRVIWQNLG